MKKRRQKCSKKRVQVALTIENFEKLEQFCKETGMTKSAALQFAWAEFIKAKG